MDLAAWLRAKCWRCRRCEVQLFSFGQRLYATCIGASQTQIVDVSAAPLEVAPWVARARVEHVAQQLAKGRRYELQWLERADDFYYPTHGTTDFASPFVRITVADASYYLDPRSPQLLRYTTQRKRLERWLYNGLHSWDFAWLYRWPVVWRALLVIAMLCGLSLSVLGLMLPITRSLRRRKTLWRAHRA